MKNTQKIVIVMQARSSSARLPAKALLPIAGFPLAVLAAKRASNTGIKLIAVTSLESDDDFLSQLFIDHGVDVYRGSLDNVLDRFVRSTAGLDESTILIRTTADNVFPDGRLIEELVAKYLSLNVPYLHINGNESGVPYGLSAEATRLSFIREANVSEPSQFDKEHVTSYVRRNYGVSVFTDSSYIGFGNLRCTIDYYDDYTKVGSIFSGFLDPVSVPVEQLLMQLADIDPSISPSKTCSKLVIGGAQFGMKYGITNNDGEPDITKAAEVLKFCIDSGSRFIDTAASYGTSEIRIGESAKNGWRQDAKVITKFTLPVQNELSLGMSELYTAIEKNVLQSCFNLNTTCLDVLLFHRASDLNAYSGYALTVLLEKKKQGLIAELGVSVQSPQELRQALMTPELSFIQLPFNLLDSRWNDVIPLIYKEKLKRRLTIHCRSALLQGLIGSDNVSLWSQVGIKNYPEIKKWFEHHCRVNKCQNSLELAVRYVISTEWVDGIVVGFENIDQAREITGFLLKGDLPLQSLEEVEISRPLIAEDALDPSTWEVESL